VAAYNPELRSAEDQIVPSDYIPASYWDGKGSDTHSLSLLFSASLGPWCIIISSCILTIPIGAVLEEYSPTLHARLEKYLGTGVRFVCWSWLFLFISLGLCYTLAMWFIFLTGLGEAALRTWTGNFVLKAYYWLAIPVAPFFFLLMLPIMAIFILPFEILSYFLRAYVIGSIDAGRSAFFIPWTNRSIWELDQLASCLFGLILLGFQVWMIKIDFHSRRASSSATRS
jgi:hypothetical protein